MPRIIYSLLFELEPQEAGDSIELVAPLTPDGQSPACRAVAPKTRVIDLRPGDHVHYQSGRYKIRRIKAYRDAQIRGDSLSRASDGYIVRGS